METYQYIIIVGVLVIVALSIVKMNKKDLKLELNKLVELLGGKDNILDTAKETLIASIKASTDSPAGIINTYYAKVLVDSADFDKRIEEIKKVTKEDIINLSKKIHINTVYLLERTEEDGEN